MKPQKKKKKKKKKKKRKPLPYAEVINTAAFKKSLVKSINANSDCKACKAGHNLGDPKRGHIHVGTLLPPDTGYPLIAKDSADSSYTVFAVGFIKA